MMVFTESSQIKVNASQLWINSIIGADEIYIISGSSEVFNYNKKSG